MWKRTPKYEHFLFLYEKNLYGHFCQFMKPRVDILGNFLYKASTLRSGVPFVKFSWETFLFTVHGQSEKNSDVTAWVFTSITGALILCFSIL